jgi:hypothetical protein
MNRPKNKNLRLLLLASGLLAVSLACATVERMLVPGGVPPTRQPAGLPVDQPIDCDDDSCLDACLARVAVLLEAAPVSDVGGDYAGAEANFNLVTYQVDGDSISEPDLLWVPSEYKAYQQDSTAHQRTWDYFTALIPADQRKWITEYIIFTDGTYNTLAWVSEVEYGDNARWQLGVDILDSDDPRYLTETLVHEVAHLITLNSDQIASTDDFAYTPYQNKSVCPQFILEEGCSTPQSYINKFYQKFWVDIYNEWLETVYKSDTTSDEEFRAVVQNFYSNHTDEFLREYAATNIKEDLAVTFESFVLQPKPVGDSVTDRKILFYYDFPELVALRSQVIHSICSYSR